MPWRIISGPVETRDDYGAVAWGWTLGRGRSERRDVLVRVSADAMSRRRAGLPKETREAIRTKGRAALTTYLKGEGDPRREIVFTTWGRARF